jgi:uncharacterized protein YprB with RNaseH-like and TPR domain
MLAFDIETESLNRHVDNIILASVYDTKSKMERTFHFMRDPALYESERDAFILALDEADILCSFNGVRFDIPFICTRCRIAVANLVQV